MHDSTWYDEEAQWMIWNGVYGIVDTVTIRRVEIVSDRRDAWLDDPYDMVGPFSLDKLEAEGKINFAACTVMSRQRWKEEQVNLRQESLKKRRFAQEQMYEDIHRYNQQREVFSSYQVHNEKAHRKLLNLPIEGDLASTQIKAAFRIIAKKAHPDVGGSHEAFIEITQARDLLLKIFS